MKLHGRHIEWYCLVCFYCAVRPKLAVAFLFETVVFGTSHPVCRLGAMEQKTIQLATILFKGSRSIGLKREEVAAAPPKKVEPFAPTTEHVTTTRAIRTKGCASGKTATKQKTKAAIHSRDEVAKSIEKPEKAAAKEKKKTQSFQAETELIGQRAGCTAETVRSVLDALGAVAASELRAKDKFSCGLCVMKLKREDAKPAGAKKMFGKVVETQARDAMVTIRFIPSPQLLAKVRES